MRKKRWWFVAGAVVVVLFLMSFAIVCRGSQYTLQAFCFPPGSEPHESNWEYLGMVITETTSAGSMYRRNPKQVRIQIRDKSERSVLDDSYDFDCSSVKANVSWDTFEVLELELLEEGDEYVDDAYSRKLAETGPQRLLMLKYQYNPDTKKFEKVD